MVIRKPKLPKEYNNPEQIDDLVLKRQHLSGRHRLCICSNSFLLFDMNANPTSNVDEPFKKENFIDLPVILKKNLLM